MLRALSIGAFFFTATPILISLQWLLGALGLPGRSTIALNYYRVLRTLLRIRVRVVGAPPAHGTLVVSNHVSWADIIVIGSLIPVAFVAKREVASWPLVGVTAKLQRTVFVDRTRRQQTAAVAAEIAQRLAEGISVVLFAEGTSSDGNRVLPFRSALVGAIENSAAAPMAMQPLSICYTGVQGYPMGRQHRPLVAWYGDLDFLPHIRKLIGHGPVDAVVSFGEPVSTGAADRKTITRTLEGTVRRLTASALRGRALPEPVTG